MKEPLKLLSETNILYITAGKISVPPGAVALQFDSFKSAKYEAILYRLDTVF